MTVSHHTTQRWPPTNNSTTYPSQKLPHENSTANPHMMDQFPCVYKGTLTYSTVPRRLCISPSRAHLPPSHLLALPTRLDMQCTSHHTITYILAKIPFSPGSLHNNPVMRVVYTSSFSRETTTTTPLSLVFTPFNGSTKLTSPLHTRHLINPHNIINTTTPKNLNKTCSP